MPSDGLLRRVDAVQVPVPSLAEGLAFYGEALGHRLLWRNDAIGQAGLALPDGDSELVLTTTRPYEPNWLVDDVPTALTHITTHGTHHRAQCLNMLRQLGVTPLPPSSVAEWTWLGDAQP